MSENWTFQKLVLRGMWLLILKGHAPMNEQTSFEIDWAKEMDSYIQSMEA